jgi:hypothetical protein
MASKVDMRWSDQRIPCCAWSYNARALCDTRSLCAQIRELFMVNLNAHKFLF